ncbi:MAG TPA: hypothetical protein VFV41_08110 [Streptosporangiaceae bacterium]|nr:hypothetical protein [Streptosporangiaceae bacterium]
MVTSASCSGSRAMRTTLRRVSTQVSFRPHHARPGSVAAGGAGDMAAVVMTGHFRSGWPRQY